MQVYEMQVQFLEVRGTLNLLYKAARWPNAMTVSAKTDQRKVQSRSPYMRCCLERRSSLTVADTRAEDVKNVIWHLAG